ncbi:MAG: hypothetical protein RR791_05485 [Lachnospiraceae bacterium]
MEDITLKEKIYTHGGSDKGFFLGTPGVRDGKPVLIHSRHGHDDYIDVDILCSQVRECLMQYMK